jgi:glycosyltransferase involved in cell wall biosynthesis
VISTDRCAAVIPCLNEQATISAVISDLRQHVGTVYVVDDGSSDETSSRAEAAGARLLRHSSNKGKGAALRSGWNRALRDGFSWALTLDGDGQHACSDVAGFFKAVEKTGARLVIGNRMHDADRIPWLRRFVNRAMSRWISKAAGCELPDSQCGFRLMNLHDWQRMNVHADHFEIESDVVLQFIRGGLLPVFVPIQVIYKGERSKINPLRDTIRWFRWWRAAQRRCQSINKPRNVFSVECGGR